MLTLESKTNKLYKIGPKTETRLRKLGIDKIKDFLFHFPLRYNDYSHLTKIAEAEIGREIVIKGRIIGLENSKTYSGKIVTQALISDKTGTISVIWFNQPFLKRLFKTGSQVVLAGKVSYNRFSRSRALISPDYELIYKDSLPRQKIIPVYSETKGISSKWLRSKIEPLLRFASRLKDPLPEETRKEMNLVDLPKALNQIHFPDSQKSLREAKRRFAFEELFKMTLFGLLQKKEIKNNRSLSIKFKDKLTKDFVARLPFRLTDDQRKASWEIISDLGRSSPMCRLLNGDVGSGKTVVAAIVAVNVVKNGYRVVLMAPTEVLACQHFQTFSGLFREYNYSIGLYTQSYKKTNKGRDPMRSDIIIGTHALIQKGVKIKKIALAIIDEQHRFGVKQRAKLRSSTHTVPHLLTMTATPIPRTMSITLFGDLDVSFLTEMPQGRKKIITKIVPPKEREAAYEFIRAQINSKRQVFVVCPLIYESDILGVKSVEEEHQKLSRDIFPNFSIGLLHGRMRSKEKERIRQGFSKGEYDILVSTSVIEVGLDVPRASVMMIEGAERFGLSQLHQFRGRVGRGKYQSYCFLFADSWSDKIRKRLKTIASTEDGFKIANIDLQMRGPGEVFGVRQSGIPDLKLASWFDYKMVKQVRTEAERIVAIDSSLKKWPLLKREVEKIGKEQHLE